MKLGGTILRILFQLHFSFKKIFLHSNIEVALGVHILKSFFFSCLITRLLLKCSEFCFVIFSTSLSPDFLIWFHMFGNRALNLHPSCRSLKFFGCHGECNNPSLTHRESTPNIRHWSLTLLAVLSCDNHHQVWYFSPGISHKLLLSSKPLWCPLYFITLCLSPWIRLPVFTFSSGGSHPEKFQSFLYHHKLLAKSWI